MSGRKAKSTLALELQYSSVGSGAEMPDWNKRGNGQYFTARNPFQHRAFIKWAKQAELSSAHILEPFAGSNFLIRHLETMGLCNRFTSFDIEPAADDVVVKDTLANFPAGYDVCITNPPWLAKNSATARGLQFPDCAYDDLYKFALERCLDNCDYVAALIPESFINAGIFHDRLTDFISLTTRLFVDTAHPVGLALFLPNKTNKVTVYSDNKRLGFLTDITNKRPLPDNSGPRVEFNAPDGNVGLIAIDNTREASIRFCDPRELGAYEVRRSCRSITKLKVSCRVQIDKWNEWLTDFREETHDVLMTSFRGVRKDGRYRRRMDWALARGIIHHA